jgi:type I site-specific restriction-modification system R (restriction) subunit
MLELNLLAFQSFLRIKETNNKRQVFDILRKKWIQITPEETVRQLFLLYLIHEKNYNKNRISVERGLWVNDLQKRFDILIRNSAMQPLLLVECKAPYIELSDAVFEQVGRYNLPLQAQYLVITNGRSAYCAKINHIDKNFKFMDNIPDFHEIM